MAVAGNRTWAEADSGAARDVSSLALSVDAGKMPAATALALVLLACWGVVLVTRGRVRRVVAALGVLAALGALASVVVGWTSVVDALRNDLASVGVTGVEIGHTGWFWAAAVGAVLALVASVARGRAGAGLARDGQQVRRPRRRAAAHARSRGPVESRSVEGHGRGARPHRRSG